MSKELERAVRTDSSDSGCRVREDEQQFRGVQVDSSGSVGR